MNVLVILFYIWCGVQVYIVNYIKQLLFQGKDVLKSPWEYLKNLRFVFSFLAIMGIAQGTWLVDALVRQKLKLSETYGLMNLISIPVSVTIMLTTLWLSERHLSDRIVWWAAGLVVVGTLLGMIGGYFLLGGNN